MIKLSIFFLASLLMFSSNLLAQDIRDSSQSVRSTNTPAYNNLKKGAFTLTLNGSVMNYKSMASWSLTSQAGYLVANRLVVGLQLSLANRFSKQEYRWANLKPGNFKEYAFTPELYARYYVLPFRLSPFLQLSSGYNFGEATGSKLFSGEKISVSTNNYVMFGALGLSLRIGKNMGLQAQYNLPIIVDPKTNYMIRDNRFRLGLSLYLR